MPFYLLASDGETPIATDDVEAWGRFMQTDRHVAETSLDDGPDRCVWISTVFLGLDHGFGRGVPVLWESMVFGGDLDGEQWRYTSAREARAGHAAVVERLHHRLAHTEGAG